ncbi:hypothetical protein L8P05_19035 [Enterobacter cloacae]|uniref:hypothetical protein n=1 Tax=Enterobacter cloacae TaxID=550 RepID=UPI0020050371|nr:hypothetical protein [Enterobacter cloacae]MCK7176019.1 hypothetical protein [Enterobacter cloacae]
MSNIDKQTLADDESVKTYFIHPAAFGSTKNPGYGHIAVVRAEDFEKMRTKLEAAENLAKQQGNIAVELFDEVTTLRRNADDKAPELRSQLEEAEKRIAELEASHGKLREAMAGIHNTISGGGAYTPLAAILNASKRAYEESAAAAGKGE